MKCQNLSDKVDVCHKQKHEQNTWDLLCALYPCSLVPTLIFFKIPCMSKWSMSVILLDCSQRELFSTKKCDCRAFSQTISQQLFPLPASFPGLHGGHLRALLPQLVLPSPAMASLNSRASPPPPLAPSQTLSLCVGLCCNRVGNL